jgi:hypothetical protein
MRVRLLPLFFPLFLAACAGQSTVPRPRETAPIPILNPPAKAAEVAIPSLAAERAAALTAVPEAPEVPEEEDRLTEGSDLKNAISRWIAENPKAEFDEVARMANHFLRLHGYPMVLDASGLVKIDETHVRLKSGKKTFVFESGKELSREIDICGERFLRIPARIISSKQAALVVKGREFPVSLEGFKREEFKVYRGKKLISKLYAPEPTEPIGLSANGKALYMKFFLNDAQVAPWWLRVGTHQPSVIDEEAYLKLRVEKNRLYFDETLEHLPAQEFEVEETPDASFRWAFEPSGLTLLLSARCG